MKRIFVQIIPGVIFLILWQCATQNNPSAQFFFSTPSVIAQTFFSEIQTIELWRDVAVTAFAMLCGLALGTLIGTALGVLMWVSPRLHRISQPYLLIISAVPVFALAPMLILWFGIGLWSKIVMAAFSVTLVALAQTHAGVQDVARHHMLFAQSLNASLVRQTRFIMLPGAVHWLRAGLKMNIGVALTAVFIGEFISSQYGLGHYILKAGSLYDMARVFTGLILMALLATVTNTILTCRARLGQAHRPLPD